MINTGREGRTNVGVVATYGKVDNQQKKKITLWSVESREIEPNHESFVNLCTRESYQRLARATNAFFAIAKSPPMLFNLFHGFLSYSFKEYRCNEYRRKCFLLSLFFSVISLCK